jgi:phosphatidylinositol glycan class M
LPAQKAWLYVILRLRICLSNIKDMSCTSREDTGDVQVTRRPSGIGIICLVAFLVRVIVSVLGEYLDNSTWLQINYTDVDYHVFSDGARLLAAGQSPYARVTYRYPPIVAWLLLPVNVFPLFGKLLFSVGDVGCLHEIYRILMISLGNESSASSVAWVYALNPLLINICTRGSMDSIPNWFVLVVVRLLNRPRRRINGATVEITSVRLLLAGLAYGIVIHLRLFPVIYAPLYVVHLISDEVGFSRHWVLKSISSIAVFGISAGCSSVLATMLSYYSFGEEYLNNAVWYHLTRVDHRHNFSMHFYSNYLELGCQRESFQTPLENFAQNLVSKILFFAPQCVLILVVAWKYRFQPLYHGILLTTMIFVTFNKVSTAQYFIWYAPFMHLCSPFLLFKLRLCPKHINVVHILVLICWLGSGVSWLYHAYQLEFESVSNFWYVWKSTAVFFVMNCAVIGLLAILLKP